MIEKIKKKWKPKYTRYLVIGLCIVIILIAVIISVSSKIEKMEYQTTIFYAGQYTEPVIGNDNYVFGSLVELESIFPEMTFDSVDFDNHHYALVTIPYDECSEHNVKPTRYGVKNNTIFVDVEYESGCGFCPQEYIYYLVEIDKDVVGANVEINYHVTNQPSCDPNIAYKPMIYLYPEQEQIVQVILGKSDHLTTTYPRYENSWNVIAYPDGTLKDLSLSREYYGLYWEGNSHSAYVHNTGFVVKGEDTISFLEEKLRILGLTDKEANEFIVYWLPKLESNPYNYIYFETIDEINNYMPLEISPTPDSMIRIQMDYKPLNSPISILEENLVSPNRTGFTVIEWGGSIIKK